MNADKAVKRLHAISTDGRECFIRWPKPDRNGINFPECAVHGKSWSPHATHAQPYGDVARYELHEDHARALARDPVWCGIHQHFKWCEHNGGVLGPTGHEAPPEAGR
jgi:hypothetical protein